MQIVTHARRLAALAALPLALTTACAEGSGPAAVEEAAALGVGSFHAQAAGPLGGTLDGHARFLSFSYGDPDKSDFGLNLLDESGPGGAQAAIELVWRGGRPGVGSYPIVRGTTVEAPAGGFAGRALIGGRTWEEDVLFEPAAGTLYVERSTCALVEGRFEMSGSGYRGGFTRRGAPMDLSGRFRAARVAPEGPAC